MLEFIKEHYLIIMIVTLFLIFALIGYIIDSVRNKKRSTPILEANADITEEISEPEIVPENVPDSEEITTPEEVIPEEIKDEPQPDNIEDMIPEVEESEDNN